MRSREQNSHNAWTVCAVAVVCIITFFVNNSVISPDIMESRNIITAREMVYDGHWMVPTLNGELRLEKPPLPTWLTAVAEMVSPDSVALQRGMAGLAALLMIFYFWRFARRIMHVDPLIPTLLLCTCYNVILMGRTASWDIYCHAFMMAGIYYWARGLTLPAPAWDPFIAAGFFTGLSIMSKGPVSPYALFLPFLISFIIFYRPSARRKVWPIIVAVLIALAVGSWWYIYIHVAEADALQAVIGKETGSWVNRNVRPWWYYWQFFLEAGVWCVLLLTSMFLPAANGLRRRQRQWLFSLGWMLFSLILLSLLPEKKTRYLFPLLIPAAYLMGCMVAWWREKLRNPERASRADRICFRINVWLVAVAVIILPVAGWLFLVQPGYVPLWGWIVSAVVAAGIAAWLIYAGVRYKPVGMVASVTVLFLLAECFAMPSLGNIINNPEMHSIALSRNVPQLKGIPFYYIEGEELRPEIVYAAGRVIRPISPDSLPAHLPVALLTHQPAAECLPPTVLRRVALHPVDTYDDNRRPRTNKRYSPRFIYHVTLCTPRPGSSIKINQ